MLPLTHRILPKNHKAVRNELDVLRNSVAGGGTLELGEKSRAVTILEKHLRNAGIAVGRTSDTFDAGTLQAVQKFQRARHLEPTGVVDAATTRKLAELDLFVGKGFNKVAQVGQRGADIGAMEKRLKKLGFKPGKLDGIFDKKLKGAVSKFQKSRGMKHHSGRIGTGTYKEAKEARRIQQRLAHSPKLRLVRDLAMAAKRHGVPAELPIMTALVESNFSNPSGGDRDSVGMFQQRDAWGSYAERHDPRKSVKMFLEGGHGGQRGAVDFKGQFKNKGSSAYGRWCQAVQVSAFPDRYQERLGEARRLLRQAGVPLGLKKH